MKRKILSHLGEIEHLFDTFLFDAYGVFNFDSNVSQTAIDVMAQLVSQGKNVAILSNATYLSEDAAVRYSKKGVFQGIHYHKIITSGQFAHEDILQNKLPLSGKKVFVFGTANFQKPENKVPGVFSGSDYEIVEDIDYADFVYCGIPQIDYKDKGVINEFIPLLAEIECRKLPMLCANPDLRAVEDGRFVVRQGLICSTYEDMMGKVVYYGKPDPRIFSRTLAELDVNNVEKVLMIGDTDRTDILGANRAGIKSCLILEQGVTADEMLARGIDLTYDNVEEFLAKKRYKADFICKRLPALPL